MASFNKLIDHNKHMSILLFGFMAILFGIFGASIGAYWGGDWITGVVIAVLVAGLYFLISWKFGDSMILASSGARQISHEDSPQLWNVVEEISIAGGMPMPKVYLIEDEAMNAFATGRDPKSASVAITRGLLQNLNREELQGVMAHEMSHVRNYDIRFAMLMAVMVGSIVLLADVVRRSIFYSSLGGRRRRDSRSGGQAQAVLAIAAVVLSIIAPLLATIIQLAVSRQREYLADASAVELTRNPAGLISALKKLTADTAELKNSSQGMQHLYIVNPLLRKKKGKDSLFSTHPALESRIERLEGLMKAYS
ncbi:MAG: zinc metalloprotease HtpX [Synergistaceae bacterium]|jgi:heat shock protein HtpX|uniref:zinc metalloprotease HtpX n=1 Tax=Aminivibrio sp. TaxID=1872489 RepID=UPI002A21E2B6|nr:zinc metalloprotease HtpX [Synergistaceae bacterium]MDD3391581.1 zinc metalloprotease HtpX [Synergistaceae bacterium]MDD3689426.1 zinc metalloprotease HtpX [Synergistaceae bacterium]MDD4022020.1 zinc metalloprotease HtpX [Synergistaceae bacterium]MDD4612905.1 zinc metalloprotease HtpX [Synergistaceae bacterium]